MILPLDLRAAGMSLMFEVSAAELLHRLPSRSKQVFQYFFQDREDFWKDWEIVLKSACWNVQ